MKFRYLFSLIMIGTCTAGLTAQEHTTYYDQRASHFQTMPAVKGKIIFCGNSITDGGEWQELFNDLNIVNRGISGDVSQGVIDRLDEMTSMHPSKFFLLIGVNDLARGTAVNIVANNIQKIITQFSDKSPETKVYIQSILPVNAQFNKFSTHVNKTDSIIQLNSLLKNICAKGPAKYVDLFSRFVDANNRMNPSLTNDGLHLTGKGYMLWKKILFPLVYDLSIQPSLLPAPAISQWTGTAFPLFEKMAIRSDDVLKAQLPLLKNLLEEKNIRYTEDQNSSRHSIRLRYKKMDEKYLSEEAYEIKTDSSEVNLYAESAVGIFYALQTLRQLMRDGVFIPGCYIKDKPAFAWRGLMHDVGRNFQSIRQLKMQIDLMSRYKMNIFHFHLTEDIAWRLQSRLYPQLTADSNMLRNPGDYYTLEEVKDLVQYCKERFITLIPEIDMPGHSAAFKRAMSVDMQSVQGLIYCKNIITEVCKELDVPYIHIGGDEVKITNKDFLPEIAALVKSLGKKVIAWDPGGVLPKGTVLQMWNGQTLTKPGMPALDSRHLYVNHHDPIDGVVSVFNHMICDVSKGDSEKLGAIACVWPDRRVSKEEDILTMNPVFPEMLTLAERSWKGGGWKKYLSDIDKPGTERYEAFTEFEARLLDHQQLYFASLPFPYVKQSNIHWKLIGPFNNQGDLTKVFAPENHTIPDNASLTTATSVYGGTVFLRHFWAPMIGSHLPDPKENTTYYAFTQIFSAYEQNIGLWISFYNISRSNNTATPDSGKWDNRESKIWLNNKEIPAPLWSKPGRKNKGMETPLIDEGYEYRKPTTVTLQKGWNTVLLKLPVSSFKSADWQSPVKWMFSCMPVAEKNGMPVFPDGISIDPSGVHQ